jgi:uncharacterized membrane protein YdfJ with MMPL/SSD domain
MKLLGFALAIAVALDVTVIRLALGPALLRLAGRWNWWPGGVPDESPIRTAPVEVPLGTRETVAAGHTEP